MSSSVKHVAVALAQPAGSRAAVAEPFGQSHASYQQSDSAVPPPVPSTWPSPHKWGQPRVTKISTRLCNIKAFWVSNLHLHLSGKVVIQQTVCVLRDLVDSISGEATKSRQICYHSLQESVQVTLALFPLFIQQPGKWSCGEITKCSNKTDDTYPYMSLEKHMSEHVWRTKELCNSTHPLKHSWAFFICLWTSDYKASGRYDVFYIRNGQHGSSQGFELSSYRNNHVASPSNTDVPLSLSDVADEMLSFFLTLFQALRVQMGIAFTEQIIQTFLSMFTRWVKSPLAWREIFILVFDWGVMYVIFFREQLAVSILQEGSSGSNVVQKFLKILQVRRCVRVFGSCSRPSHDGNGGERENKQGKRAVVCPLLK